jgi:hypothetical protein
MIARPLARLVGFSALAGAGNLRIGRELVTRDIDYMVANRYLIILATTGRVVNTRRSPVPRQHQGRRPMPKGSRPTSSRPPYCGGSECRVGRSGEGTPTSVPA